MAFFFASEKNQRSANEDSYCQMELRINHEASVEAYVVADGMGGMAAGKDYSNCAVQLWYEQLLHAIMSDEFKNCSLPQQIETLRDFSLDVFEEINHQLYLKGLDAGLRGGTTLSTVIHFWDTWILANVGDSPIYIAKDGAIKLASEIQNMAGQMVRDHKIEEGSTIYYQNKNRLMEYLGRREPVHPHQMVMEDRELDGFIVGSDGAFGNLRLSEIEAVLLKKAKKQDILKNLFQAAQATGEEDNQTAIVYIQDSAKKRVPEKKMPGNTKRMTERPLDARSIKPGLQAEAEMERTLEVEADTAEADTVNVKSISAVRPDGETREREEVEASFVELGAISRLDHLISQLRKIGRPR